MNNGNLVPINGNYANHQRPPRTLSIPRTFFTPSTSRLLQSIAPDFQHNPQQSSQPLALGQDKTDLAAECTKLKCKLLKKDSELKAMNDLMESQIAALQNGYESRIRQLNQDILHVKSTEEQKLFKLQAECAANRILVANRNDVIAGKNTEMKALENRLKSKNLTLEQEKRHLEAQCAKLSDQLLRKDAELKTLKQPQSVVLQDDESKMRESRIRELNQEIELLKSSEQQKLSFLEAQFTEIKDKLLKQNSELKALNDVLKSQTLSLGQEKRESEAQCAKFIDELLKKYYELEALNAKLQAELQECNLKLAKSEEENRELKQKNERISRESQQKFNQMESEKVASANSLAKLNESMAEVERDYMNFVNSFSSQISKLKEKNNKLNEENEILKADRTGTQQLRYTVEKLNKTDHHLGRTIVDNQSINCKTHLSQLSDLRAENVKLKAENKNMKQEHEAQFLNLKRELELEKKANERLSSKNKEFEKEAKRLLSTFFVSSNDGQGSSDEQNEDGNDGNSGPTMPKKKKTG